MDDNLLIAITLLGMALIVLGFMAGYMLGVDAMRKARPAHSPEFLPMRMDK